MAKCYHGKILFVDLTSGSTREKTIDDRTYRDFIGGQGLGARLLYEYISPKADPLGPDNVIGFLPGLLTGTGIHGSRCQVVSKSPITNGWGDSNFGGSFGTELKNTGYDGIFLSGISPKPVYLYLHDCKAEIRDASYLWGRDTIDTEELVHEATGDSQTKVACIGPSGEVSSLMAAIMHHGCAAARGGMGAVMGAKRLKAIAIKGNLKISVADPARFSVLKSGYLNKIKKTDNFVVKGLKDRGTCGFFSIMLLSGDTPIKNWQYFGEQAFPTHEKIDGVNITKYQTRKHSCLGCPVACKGWITIEDSRYGRFETTKIDYETLGMLGANCMIDDVASLAKANDLCNRFGIDTISTGSVVAFAMELYERGILTKTDTDGVELSWGNGDALVEIIQKIGRREGLGALLADGTKFAAERIGKGSEEFAIQIGGQDMPAHVPTATIGHAWGYVNEPTPARHTATHIKMAHDGHDPDFFHARHLPQLDPTDIEANAPYWAVCCALDRLWTSAGMCCFAIWPDALPLVDVISAATGWDFTIEEGIKVGRRIQTLRQAFNCREGIDTTKWVLPKRASLANSGPNKGRKIDFTLMKRKGYEALGWDPNSGRPLDSTLEELKLKEIVGQI